MKIIIILNSGRSGSSFLQSLFDKHPEVLQFPGEFLFNDKMMKIFNIVSPNKFISSFVKLNNHFFDSRLNKFERHNKLGNSKKEYYKIDIDKFKFFFLKSYEKSKKTNLEKLICLHTAYGENNHKNKKKKILLVNLHSVRYLKNYEKTLGIKSDKILLTLRDPLASFSSTIKNWQNYNNGVDLTPATLMLNIQNHFDHFNNLHFLRKKIKVVKLEKLHLHNKKTLKKICKFLNISFSKVLLKSTFHGKKWWGDSVSKKFLNGVNPKFKNNFDQNYFNNQEINYLERRIFSVLKKYEYPVRSQMINKKVSSYFLPFTFEKKVWISSIKKDFKKVLSVPFYYFKRVLVIHQSNKYGIKNLPNEI